ncbi:unnamed protein product [Owenia fusiformis]|uniref:Uncharacterized protein n=1 Tax=Owenia fusiformis TaxID=6347 RepID=A0A8J1U5X2_OWEFU|nr:unnamed protein product [Owenia fusiformis]
MSLKQRAGNHDNHNNRQEERKEEIQGDCSNAPSDVSFCRYMNCRALPGNPYNPTNHEHLANVATHGLLIVPSIFGLGWMLTLADESSEFWIAVIYGAALVALFTVSTTYHTISFSGKFNTLKNILHIGDRAAIYIFVAASYTPWLVTKEMSLDLRVEALWVIWTMAILGILYQYNFHEKYKSLEVLFYLIIGVCPAMIVVFAMKESSGLHELALGGIIYIIGTMFFKLDGIVPFAHAIWHCFVIVGATIHYYAVCKYVLGVRQVALVQETIQIIHDS